eukprot:COSAG01_NODE_2964_length_6791_cov_2.291542_6_plen_169_part_00
MSRLFLSRNIEGRNGRAGRGGAAAGGQAAGSTVRPVLSLDGGDHAEQSLQDTQAKIDEAWETIRKVPYSEVRCRGPVIGSPCLGVWVAVPRGLHPPRPNNVCAGGHWGALLRGQLHRLRGLVNHQLPASHPTTPIDIPIITPSFPSFLLAARMPRAWIRSEQLCDHAG